MIASHSYVIAIGQRAGVAAEPLGRLTGHRTEMGSIAVDGFFAASGFLLAASWGRGKGLANFATRRFLRIYPGFLVCVLACVLLVGPAAGVMWSRYFADPVTYRLFRYLYFGPFMDALPGAFARNPLPELVNTSLWTIKFECYCYAILMVLGVIRLLRPAVIAGLAIVCMAGLTFVSLSRREFGHGLNSYYMPRLVTFFFAGSALYLNRARVPFHAGLFAGAVAVTAATVTNPIWPTLILPTAGLYCMFYVACLRWPRTNRIGRRNDLSYGVYLYAFPIQQLLVYRGLGSGRPWLLTALTLPPVFVAAFISWVSVERPALQFKPTLRRRRPLPESQRPAASVEVLSP